MGFPVPPFAVEPFRGAVWLVARWLSSAALRSPCFSALSFFLPPALASAVLHLGRFHLFTVMRLVHVDGAR